MQTISISGLSKNKVVTNEMINLVKKLTEQFEVGQYDLANGAFAVAETFNAKPADTVNYQTHKKYIRVHIILSGFEMFLSSQMRSKTFLEVAPYDAETDVLYLKGETAYEPILLQSEEFMVVYPGEVYKSGVAIPKAISRTVKKLTIYVPKEQ